MSILSELGCTERTTPLVLPGPTEHGPVGLREFSAPRAWMEFIGACDLPQYVPDVVSRKYRRAQSLYRLGWIDEDVIKAGDLAALVALELALRDRYGTREAAGKSASLAALLRFCVAEDGLTDLQLPIIQRHGGSAIGQITGAVKPSLADLRNAMAHGDPFDATPIGGLLELVHDITVYAYRGLRNDADVSQRSAE